jgi:hypothetical protein
MPLHAVAQGHSVCLAVKQARLRGVARRGNHRPDEQNNTAARASLTALR